MDVPGVSSPEGGLGTGSNLSAKGLNCGSNQYNANTSFGFSMKLYVQNGFEQLGLGKEELENRNEKRKTVKK